LEKRKTRAELLNAYSEGKRCFEIADLRDADLRNADLRGADLDFSCFPLWCGGLNIKIDRHIAAQLAYHFCAQTCDDGDYIAVRNAILPFANSFHRVDEVGRLEAIYIGVPA
jgi:uncharacterized protein YjbI with pentapeptide repeats